MQNTLTREELKQHIEKNDELTLVDALAEEDFKKAHLPGALNIPVDQVAARAAQILRDKNAFIVTYCAGESCDASRKAAETLRKLGYQNVQEYRGGKDDWESAGYPLEGTSCSGGVCSTGSGGKDAGIPAA